MRTCVFQLGLCFVDPGSITWIEMGHGRFYIQDQLSRKFNEIHSYIGNELHKAAFPSQSLLQVAHVLSVFPSEISSIAWSAEICRVACMIRTDSLQTRSFPAGQVMHTPYAVSVALQFRNSEGRTVLRRQVKRDSSRSRPIILHLLDALNFKPTCYTESKQWRGIQIECSEIELLEMQLASAHSLPPNG